MIKHEENLPYMIRSCRKGQTVMNIRREKKSYPSD